MNYLDILNTITTTISQPAFYWQMLSVASCLLLTFVFYKITKHLFYLKIKSDKGFEESSFNKIISQYISPLFLPALAIIILSSGMAVFSEFYIDTFLFTSLIQLIALLLFLRFIKAFLGSNLMSNIAATFLIPAVILSIFGFLEPTIAYLDSVSFTMGSIRISIYTVAKASLILLIVFWMSGLISRKSKSYIKNNNQIKPNTKGVLNKIIDMVIYFVVFIVLLRVFGVDTTTFAVLGGAIGVGIGLGLQKIASNFIGGIILLFEKSVEIGDLVEINGNIEGTITHFGGRYTLLETFDGKEIMVPNEEFIINKVVNLTYNNNRGRIEIEVRVAYDSDIDKVQETMVNVAKEHPKCLLYPSPEAYITEFGESSINIKMYFWINNVTDGRIRPKSEVMSEILKKFRKNKIIIPFPQRDLNLSRTIAKLIK
jgi:small-conductance mechanosensitive channel